MLAVLSAIWQGIENTGKLIVLAIKWVINVFTFEFRLLDMMSGIPALTSNLLFWLPSSCLAVITSVIAIQIIIKVFSRGQG